VVVDQRVRAVAALLPGSGEGCLRHEWRVLDRTAHVTTVERAFARVKREDSRSRAGVRFVGTTLRPSLDW
jgi:hypothetical protein